jgi:hypothetical protein
MEQQINSEMIYEKLLEMQKSMITRNELDSVFETIQILSNPVTMRQIEESEKDIREGNTWEINSVSDL